MSGANGSFVSSHREMTKLVLGLSTRNVTQSQKQQNRTFSFDDFPPPPLGYTADLPIQNFLYSVKQVCSTSIFAQHKNHRRHKQPDLKYENTVTKKERMAEDRM